MNIGNPDPRSRPVGGDNAPTPCLPTANKPQNVEEVITMQDGGLENISSS